MTLDVNYPPTHHPAVAVPERQDVEQSLLAHLPQPTTPAIGDLTWPGLEAPESL